MRPISLSKIFIIWLLAATQFSGMAAAQRVSADKLPDQPETDLVYQILKNGQTEMLFRYLINTFRKNGASVNEIGDDYDALDLKIREFTDVVNDFDPERKTIAVSRIPQVDDAEVYWENWNRVLARGNWDFRKFFRTKQEAQMLAAYNTLVLMSHEFGHYLAIRYGANPEKLFCQELTADMFAHGMMNYLSNEIRFEILRARYLELIRDIDRSIPAEVRFPAPTLDEMMSNCENIELKSSGVSDNKVSEEDYFRIYASAFFKRHGLLLELKESVPLDQIIKILLTDRLAEATSYTADKLSVRTLRAVAGDFIDDLDDYSQITTLEPKCDDRRSLRTIDQKGDPLDMQIVLEHETDPETHDEILTALTLRFYPFEKESGREEIEFKFPPGFVARYNYLKVLAATDREVYVFLGPHDADHINILKMGKNGDNWETEIFKFQNPPRAKYQGDYISKWLPTPSGKLFLVLYQETGENRTEAVYRYEVNKSDFSLKSETLIHVKAGSSPLYETLFADDEGRIFFLYSSGILLLDSGGYKRLAGTVAGIADGEDKRRIEFLDLQEARFIDSETIRVLDATSENRYLLREIKLR